MSQLMNKVVFLLSLLCFVGSCRYNARIVNPDDVTGILVLIEIRHRADSVGNRIDVL